MTLRRALYIGRFQVFHLGHLDVLRLIDAAPDVDAVAVVIGSAQYDGEHKHPDAPWAFNPFTAAERREMVEASLAGQLRKPWGVQLVTDTHACDTWRASVLAAVPDAAVLYSATPRERALFAAKGLAARDFPRGRPFHAGSIREALAQGRPWREQVPAPAAAVLERIGAAARLRALYERDRGGGGSAAGGRDQDLAKRGPAFPRERAERATEGDRP